MIFSRLSLRYRIALVIFFLEAAMLAAVLSVTLADSRNTVVEFDNANQTATLDLLSNLSVTALLTGEYADYQLYVQDIEKQPTIERIVLADTQNHVVAGSQVADVGKQLAGVVELGDAKWHVRGVDTAAGGLGMLAVRFSDDALIAASKRTRNLAVTIAVAGMMTIALVGLATGFALTRRLERVTQIARQFAAGETGLRANVGGRDEIAALATAINLMLEHLAQKEFALRKNNRALRAVSECGAATIHATSEDQLLGDVCRLIVERTGYRFAWVGWAVDDEQRSVTPVAHFGDGGAYLDASRITWDESPRGRGPTGTAIRTGKPVIAHDLLADPRFGPWLEDARRHGFASSLALPLVIENRTLGALNIYAGIPNAFDADEMELLMELAQNLAFGVRTLRAREERARALTELAQRNAQFEAIFNSIPDAVMFVDMQRRILLTNPAMRSQFGYDDAALIGQSTEILYANRTDFQEQGRLRYNMGGATNTKPHEIRYQRKDGSLFWSETLGTHVRAADGTPLGYISIVRDITERRLAEMTLRVRDRAIAASINGIAFSDLRGVITYVNHAFLVMWGYANESDVVGRSPFDLTADPAEAERALAALSRDDGWNGELVALRSDRSTFVALVSATVIRDVNGEPMQLMASFLDITERKQIERMTRALNAELELRVQERTAQLEAANRELESFSYSVSHDLRAPLRSIDGFTRVLEEDYHAQLDETARGHLARVRHATQRMGLLIDDLLNLSRVSRAALRSEPVNLSKIALDVVAELRRADPLRHVEIIIAENLNVLGDPALLRVVMQNLLGNAWKYTRRTEHARIELGETVHGGARCLFVRDNGAGFDMQYAGQLFTPFQRLHATQEFEGTGIGLATVARILRRHGGRIWADAEVGHGATFYFTLANMEN